MERKTAHDFDQELLMLFDAYVHGALDRRGFLEKAAKYAAAGVTAAMLLDQLNPRFAEAQVVTPDDPRVKVQYLEYESAKGSGRMRGYLAHPAKAAGRLGPGVLVIHENRGLNPHIEDIARRLALDDFVAFAPDALFPLGGYPGDEDKAREPFPKLEQPKTRDLVAGSIVGSGTVSNKEAGGPGRPASQGGVGYSCIAEQRTVETLVSGKPVTPFLRFGDRVRIEMLDALGHTIFGAIEQTVRKLA